jgi:hypothetical protein
MIPDDPEEVAEWGRIEREIDEVCRREEEALAAAEGARSIYVATRRR